MHSFLPDQQTAMAVETYFVTIGFQQAFLLRRMGIVAVGAIAGFNRSVNVFLGHPVADLIMALAAHIDLVGFGQEIIGRPVGQMTIEAEAVGESGMDGLR